MKSAVVIRFGQVSVVRHSIVTFGATKSMVTNDVSKITMTKSHITVLQIDPYLARKIVRIFYYLVILATK